MQLIIKEKIEQEILYRESISELEAAILTASSYIYKGKVWYENDVDYITFIEKDSEYNDTKESQLVLYCTAVAN